MYIQYNIKKLGFNGLRLKYMYRINAMIPQKNDTPKSVCRPIIECAVFVYQYIGQPLGMDYEWKAGG